MNTKNHNKKYRKVQNSSDEKQWWLEHPDGRSFRFATKPNNPGEIAIFLTRGSGNEDRFMPHCLINKARRMWHELIEEGCTQAI